MIRYIVEKKSFMKNVENIRRKCENADSFHGNFQSGDESSFRKNVREKPQSWGQELTSYRLNAVENFFSSCYDPALSIARKNTIDLVNSCIKPKINII